MGFREWWSKLKYWQKGSIMGFLISIIYYFIVITLTLIISYRSGAFNCGFYIESKPCSSSEFLKLNLLVFFDLIKTYGVSLAIIGGIIGLFIDIFKRK